MGKMGSYSYQNLNVRIEIAIYILLDLDCSLWRKRKSFCHWIPFLIALISKRMFSVMSNEIIPVRASASVKVSIAYIFKVEKGVTKISEISGYFKSRSEQVNINFSFPI